MKPESDNLQDYLKADNICDWETNSVKDKAHDIIVDCKTDEQKAERLFCWVRDIIPHSKDIDSDIVTCTASEVLKLGTGICYAKSHLLAALLRACGIPVGFCYQVLKHDPPLSGYVLHGLNGVYLRELGEWILLDSRGNTGECNAQFDLQNKMGLAFHADSSLGEFMYETIFTNPSKKVVATLCQYTSRQKMWPHLPREL